jgi:hypothetical protein
VCTSQRFVLMMARLVQLYPKCLAESYKGGEFDVLRKFPGRELAGVVYTPLFTYFESYTARGAFRVLADTYVTADSGTAARSTGTSALLSSAVSSSASTGVCIGFGAGAWCVLMALSLWCMV